MISIYANGSLLADGTTTGTGINLSVIGIIVGTILTCTFMMKIVELHCYEGDFIW